MQTTGRESSARLAATAAASVEVVPDTALEVAPPLEVRLRSVRRRRLVQAIREWIVPLVLTISGLTLVAVAVLSFLAR